MKKLSDQIAIVTNKYTVGEVRILGSTSLADNEMECFGQEIAIRDYPELFANIGFTFGTGNGPNTFRLPDFRGVILAGIDSMGAVPAKRLMELNPKMGSLGGSDRVWMDSVNGLNPYWYNNNSVENYYLTQIPPNILSTNNFHPNSDTGQTTGSGGEKIYFSYQYYSPVQNAQPTISLIYAINLGRNRVSYDPVPQPDDGPTDLEFAGPFVDFVNVVEHFGADPTGTFDSTAAIQAAINAVSSFYQLGSNADWTTWVNTNTVYFPPGTYLVSDALRLGDSRTDPPTTALGLHVVGDDPNTTIIKWIGPDDYRASIMWSAGMHDGIVARLGFDGQGTNVIGFRYERDFGVPLNQSYNRVQDCTFMDMGCGIANTDYVPGVGTDSEISIQRCRFYRCSNYGVTTYAAEAYDYFIRNCYFESCGKGVGIQLEDGYSNFYPHTQYWSNGVGQLSVYDSVFNASKECDVYGVHGQNIGVRRNVSINSFRFMISDTAYLSVTDNRIIYPVVTDCINQISQFGGGGGSRRVSIWFANNEFCMRPDASGPIYKELYFIPQDYNYGYRTNEVSSDTRLISGAFSAYNNKFNVSYEDVWAFDPRLIQVVLDTIINQTIDDTLPPLTAQIPKRSRQIFYIYPDAPGWNKGTVQDQINVAVAYAQANPGSWPVIYGMRYATGEVVVTNPIEIPANVEIAIQGQGYRSGWAKYQSYYNWSGLSWPVWLLRGPSKVKFYWMGFTQGKDLTPGRHVIVDNSDQPGARLVNDNGSGVLKTFTSNVHCLQNDLVPGVGGYDDYCVSSNWQSAGDGFVLIDGAGTGHDAPGGVDPQRYPEIEMQSGSQTYLRDIWHESNGTPNIALWTIKGNNAVQSTFFNYESSRPGITSTQGYAYSVVKFDNVKGQAVISAPVGGVANIIGDSSQFSYVTFNGPAAIDHGFYLTKFNGIPIAPKGQVNTNTDLPGWPNSYNGDIADAYYTYDTGHNWIWDGAQWIDRGGQVGTIGSAELLPGWPNSYQSAVPAGKGWHWTGSEWIIRPVGDNTGAPLVGDGFFVLDTMTFWLWNGSAWEQHTGMPMPSTYFHYMASRFWYGNPPKWFTGWPNGTAGTLPANYQEIFDRMSSVRPEKYPQALADGITDVRLERSYLNVEMWNGPYEIISNPNLVLSYDTGNVQSYPRIGSTIYDISASRNPAFFNGYINFLFDNNGILEFNGVDTWCDLYHKDLPNGTDPCTIIAWAKTYDAGGFRWILSYGTANNHQSRSLGINGTTPIWAGYADDVSGGTITAGTWFQIAGVFDGSTATLYLNGVNVASHTVSWNTVTNTAQIGRQTNGSEYWNGTIGQITVYNTALNDSDILSNYNLYKDRYGL
jgi:hypothetical protein